MAKLVNWYQFERKLQEKKILLFSGLDIRRVFGVTKVAATWLLYRYAKKGFIVRVKRGLYVFPEALPPQIFMANKIYEPSYVSLEFALSYHRVIPENVYEITSVTPKSTRRFETLGKVFSYRSLRPDAFTGYQTAKEKGFSFLIADAEKAFVDANYFRLLDGLKPISRFQADQINPAKALRYARLFKQAKLISIVKTTLP